MFGFVKVAAATPPVKVADCGYNSKQIIEYIEKAAENQVSLLVFPELSVTAYSCGDLFLQNTLLVSAQQALEQIVNKTARLDIISIVGIPVPAQGSIYNCAAVVYKGSILGLVPKSTIPNYTEFYEIRHFAEGNGIQYVFDRFAGCENVVLHAETVFCCNQMPDFKFGVEICEDLWAPGSPSDVLTGSGAAIIANLSASNELAGKASYRKDLVKIQSGKLCCGYVIANAGTGESTTDLVFSGHNIIVENGVILEESKRFINNMIVSEIDTQRIISERQRMNTYKQKQSDGNIRYQRFDMEEKYTPLTRTFPQNPFVPAAKADLQSRCEEILAIQSQGLAKRLAHTKMEHVVLGLSGGLDSTLALIVCVRAFDLLGINRTGIHTVTMPCFGTTSRTRSNAEKLANAYGVSFQEIDITKSVEQHFADIGHNREQHDVTFENCQARERTQVLMDLSNRYNGLVVGTGDLSELALGFATYNGDHMSMYGVNSSVPKTLVRFLTANEAENSTGELKDVLTDILNTPVSPELLPPKDGEIAQKTEEIVGPYELHDFFLYYFVRFGYPPKKLLYLAEHCFKNEYGRETIKQWLVLFLKRFFTQQFKRSCLPDGPKVGSVSLSPRGDWRMPSDANVTMWLQELES